MLAAPGSLYANDAVATITTTEPPSVRKKKTLFDNWKFQPDIKNIGEEENWFKLDYEKADWNTVLVPQAWDCYEEALWQYEGIGWYITSINPEDFANDKRTEILFNRVMFYSKVWLNGEYLGENIGGYLPFSFNLTNYLKQKGANTLVIRVDNRPKIEWLPAAKDIEWIQYGGILDKVILTSSAFIYIEDITITTAQSNGNAIVNCVANIVNETASLVNLELQIDIADGNIITAKKIAFKATLGAQKIALELLVKQAKLWSPYTPVLYTAIATIKNKSVVIDDTIERFGIRTISVDGTRILLNNQELILKGVNRYDDYGTLGPTVPEKLLREELATMKSVGINMIRVHYPQSPDLIALYDEFGFVMMEEIPLCWWGRKVEQTMDILTQAKPALAKMIKRDKNHPCLIIWSMSNECVTDSEIGIAVMRDLLSQAKALDPTRLVTYVIDGHDDPLKHLALDKADIICINKYYGVLHDKICRHIEDIEELGYKPFVENVTRHRKDLPSKPMMIAEFGAQGIKNMRGNLYFSEDFQAAFIERIWDGINNIEGLSGGVLWCWADYYHRKYLIGYAAFGPYGVVTTARKPKKSFVALTRMYGGSGVIKK